jgi:H+/gluconate symporter-like permease
MSKFSQALLHALKVALHILFAVCAVGAAAVVTDPKFSSAFTSAIVHYGAPVAFVNIVMAFIIKFITAEAVKEQNVTIDSLQNDPSQFKQ